VFVDGVGEPPSVIPITDVVARGEGGVMGLEVDPDVASNGFICVCTTSAAGRALVLTASSGWVPGTPRSAQTHKTTLRSAARCSA